ncbi:MAG TPA: DEAD/DEAH box helicase [Edaphocola sp.]|nr:DEAD/DEAH box helicase [Edaphocola sp.]
MSLPELLKYVYHNATEEVIRRGKKIFGTSGVQMLENDPLTEQVSFRVKNDIYNNHYKVTVNNYLQPGKLSTRCQCPYNMGPVCRHQAAALFQLNDLVQSGFFDHAHVDYNQEHTTVRMRQISKSFLKLFSSEAIFAVGEDWYRENRVQILEAKDEEVRAEVIDEEQKKYSVKIRQNEDRYFDTSCSCSEKRFPLCVHKLSTFLSIFYQHGPNYFSSLQNWDSQKNKLLALYGYSLKDDLTGKFEFAYHEGKPFLRVLDKSIKRIDPNALNSSLVKKETTKEEIAFKLENDKGERKKLGILIKTQQPYFPFTSFELIGGVPNKAGNKLNKEIDFFELNQYFNPIYLDDREKILITALRKQSSDDLVKWLKKNSPFGDFLDGVDKDLRNKPNKELQQQVWDFIIPRYQRLLQQYKEFPFVYFAENQKSKSITDWKHCAFSDKSFGAAIEVEQKGASIIIHLKIVIEGVYYDSAALNILNSALVLNGNQFHAVANIETLNILEHFDGQDQIKITKKDWDTYLSQVLMPLTETTTIHFDEALTENIVEEEPEFRLYLKETDKSIVLKPAFVYNGIEKFWLDTSSAITAREGKVIIYERNLASEQTYINLLRYLHPMMQESRKLRSFMLLAAEALKGSWYFHFMDTLRDNKVSIIDYEQLKQLRINPNKPITSLNVKSGIDWFDVDLAVSFGEEQVGIQDIKKALIKKQSFINLKDGSVGLLPDEWMDKYSLILKLGQVKEGRVRLKSVQFTALEHLQDEFDPNELLQQLIEKKERLFNYDFEHVEEIQIPSNVRATLRPYQQASFQWMKFLQDTGWGGILADDMGLGKTLQTLTFLQNIQNEKQDAKFLVVCPTSLMHNWESEIKKFTPDLIALMHHGSNRNTSLKKLLEFPLVITTYGTLRSDIKTLSQIDFDFVVLDESQAIKNPLSQVAKAAMQLLAKNRLALSGTPVQNNTFDLYAQMNFLNPGMLGSIDFFRNEFANPIDKNQDADVKQQLRKLIYPFLLRRTKEQVAPDLPEKVESVLFCEMGAKQRKIYDDFRSSYRSKILGEIETKGVEGSQMSILNGLMKLRQICDSPAILNESQKYDNHSVKIDQLVKEITENTGNHKALIFSQFLGMLDLIKKELTRLKIPFVYFDGSTSMGERQKAIKQFQEEDSTRVFLISLKAGGVGLNLTAADYVYIVDPWWNPAVEQQAIDRTHRIGQTKSIFAYRMICKDTIEEKIMMLQERKLNLVKDLIADDNAFFKQLTKDDISYLLS